MGHIHPNSMVVQSLDVETHTFKTMEDGEEMLGHNVPYLSAIGPNTSGQEQEYLSISPMHQIP